MDTKTLSGRCLKPMTKVSVLTEALLWPGTSALALCICAAAYLTETFLPNLQGIYRDGWAGPRVHVFLRHPRRYPRLSLAWCDICVCPPTALRVTVGEQVLCETTIAEPSFCLQVPLGQC